MFAIWAPSRLYRPCPFHKVKIENCWQPMANLMTCPLWGRSVILLPTRHANISGKIVTGMEQTVFVGAKRPNCTLVLLGLCRREMRHHSRGAFIRQLWLQLFICLQLSLSNDPICQPTVVKKLCPEWSHRRAWQKGCCHMGCDESYINAAHFHIAAH